jgi:hypothetical protein
MKLGQWGGWQEEQRERGGDGHLAGDEVLAHRQGHLDGIGLVGDGGGIELDLPGSVSFVGLVHGLAEHLLVLAGAQHGTDVDDLGVAGGAGEGAGEKQGERSALGACPAGRPCRPAPPGPRGLGAAGPPRSRSRGPAERPGVRGESCPRC